MPQVFQAKHQGLIVDDLHIYYSKHKAVRGISFDVPPGVTLGVLGANGAGKSSTIKSIAGVVKPTKGRIFIDHTEITSPFTEDDAKQKIGFCPDVGGVIRSATIRDHIALALHSKGREDMWWEAITLIEKFGLLDFINAPTDGFSHGMSRRLSVILAIISSEKLLVLDEPFDGVDPKGVRATFEVIDRAKSAGLSVVISTHLRDLLTEISDEIIVINKGLIVGRGKSDVFAGQQGGIEYEALLNEDVDSDIIEA